MPRCLKRSQGTWVPDKAHGGMAAAIKVPRGGTWFINEGHAGEVWVNQGGKMVSLGACSTCAGRQVVPCKVCGGSDKTPCELCETKGVIPADWKATDSPWFNRQPDVVRLKDDRVFLAREAGGDDVVVMFSPNSEIGLGSALASSAFFRALAEKGGAQEIVRGQRLCRRVGPAEREGAFRHARGGRAPQLRKSGSKLVPVK